MYPMIKFTTYPNNLMSMKKVIFTLPLFLLLAFATFAQTGPWTSSVSYLPNNPCANSPVYFSFTTNMPVSQQWMIGWWDFGDGSNATSNGPSISHTYSSMGVYNGTVLILDSLQGGMDTVNFTVWVGGDCSNLDYVTGQVYYDANNNGMMDSGEIGLPGQLVCVTNGFNQIYVTTDSTGTYGYYNDTGTDSITVIPPTYWTITDPVSGQHIVTLTGMSTTHSGNDFGLAPVANINDLEVNIYGGPPVPGFIRRYYISYRNVGSTILNGSLVMTYDQALTYDDNSTGGTHNAGAGTVSWTLPNLLPGAWGNTWVDLLADTANVNLGDTVIHYASLDPIAGDTTPNNNLDTLPQIVVGSYDPNDKLVDANPTILPGQTLTYTIRFQNTGTYWATNVVIRDSLDSNLDQSTLRIVAASHPMNHSLGGGVVSFNFPNIQLPDSGRDEPGSHGFVTYKIRANNSLVEGDHVYNTAGIYFDFNLPIITNTTDNYVDFGSGFREIYESFDVSLYPNPMSDFAWLRFQNPDQERFNFRLMDLSGKVMQEELDFTADWIRIDRGHMPAGIYLYQLQKASGESVTGKLVVQ